uniref:Exonuclease domain-containing protein n=1 Tax=Acrobeloides nanus TaxID=290746 RepID=A0A914DPI0_9BILA
MKKEVIQVKAREERNVKNKSETDEITKILAIDCEYVGTGTDGKTDSLARVSIV